MEKSLAKQFEMFFEKNMFKRYRTNEEQTLIENFYRKLKQIDKKLKSINKNE